MADKKLPAHPGKIVFYDGATNKITQEVDATSVPETIAFAEGQHGIRPVVKIVTFERGDQRIIRKYAENDEFLTSTVMINDPPKKS
jgi:hypothetical protein